MINYLHNINNQILIINYLLCFPKIVPPEFQIDRIKKSVTLKEGETVSIEIPFSCWPAPKVAWCLNRSPLYPGGHVTYNVDRNSTTLKINRAELKDAGTYSVTVENEHGKATVDIDVKVYGRLNMLTFKINKSQNNINTCNIK